VALKRRKGEGCWRRLSPGPPRVELRAILGAQFGQMSSNDDRPLGLYENLFERRGRTPFRHRNQSVRFESDKAAETPNYPAGLPPGLQSRILRAAIQDLSWKFSYLCTGQLSSGAGLLVSHSCAKSFVLDACRCFSLRISMRDYQSEFALVEENARNCHQGSSPFLSTISTSGEDPTGPIRARFLGTS
jgi:hypothetical protein